MVAEEKHEEIGKVMGAERNEHNGNGMRMEGKCRGTAKEWKEKK